MSQSDPPAEDGLPIDQAVALEQACDRFESEWRAGKRPRVEDAIVSLPDQVRPSGVRELIELDVYYRRRAGDSPRTDDYRGRFADLDTDWLVAAVAANPALVVPTSRLDHPYPAEEIGTIIAGKYKLLQEIGKGGMGLVFMADQLQPVKQRVAVKVIKAGMDSKSVLTRFEAERQALTLMDHPNIARILDAGTTDAGRPFFVMKLVKGLPLTQFCDEHKLPVSDRLNLFTQICSAVQHAHQKGIIHRDLKPTNILVESHDGKAVPKVIDFGLAKATGGMPLTEHTLFTALGSVAGTPQYMAPEQAAFNAIDVDTRADIYSLGVILYELLTGTTPIERETFKKAAWDEMLRMIREQEPVMPSSRLSSSESKASVALVRQTEPAKLGRIVRGELDWIVMKSLAKERDRRYDSATAFAKDIERFLNHELVLAGPPSIRYKLQKFVQRNKGLLVPTTLVAVALLVGTGVSTWQAVRATQAQKETDEQRRRAEKNFGKAMGAVDRMLTRVGEKRLAMVPQMEEERKRLLEDALEFYREFLKDDGNDPQVRQETARAYQRIGKIYQLLGRRMQAEEAYDHALAILQGLVDQFPVQPGYRHDQAVSFLGRAGLLAGSIGLTDRAEKDYQHAIELLEPVAISHSDIAYHRSLGLANEGLGQLYQEKKARMDDAANSFRRALEIRTRLVGIDKDNVDFQSDLARSYVSLGLLYRVMGKKPQAHESLDAALPIWMKLVASHAENPEYLNELARTHESLGQLHREASRVELAEQALGTALKIRLQLVREHSTVLEYQHELGWTHFALAELFRQAGQRGRAETALREAMTIQKRLYDEHPLEIAFAVNLSKTYGEMAALVRDNDQPQESLKWCDDNVLMLKPVLERDGAHGEARKSLSNAHMARAEALVRLCRRAEAKADWKDMVELGADQTHAELRSLRTLGLAQLANHIQATKEVNEMEREGQEPVYSKYNNACVFSLSMRAAQDDPALSAEDRLKLAEQYGDRAIKLLVKMRAEGYFQNPGALEYMKKDTDMKPLEKLADYQTLLKTLDREARARAK